MLKIFIIYALNYYLLKKLQVKKGDLNSMKCCKYAHLQLRDN